MEVEILSVKVGGMMLSDPKTTNLVDRSMTGQDRSGRLGVDRKGLVAMYPTSPSRESGNMKCHGARRPPTPWNTMFWVEELTDIGRWRWRWWPRL